MLLNSPEFIVLFLPLTLTIFFLSARFRAARVLLVAASLSFYSWQNPANLPILLGSILFNYGVSTIFLGVEGKNRKIGLWIGIIANLILLGYFKYANWFSAGMNAWLDANLDLNSTVREVALPLGISFFTFQQIAYLVDIYQKKIVAGRFLNYINFVAFFPYITAGPLSRYQQIEPQFFEPKTYQFQPQNIAVGITIFAVGLFKKVVIADAVAPYANQVFEMAATTQLTLVEAWLGALAFTLQLYFDFSGYSDMAIGVAQMFGIILPLNFNSPYKAESISDFWRRWHITLSNFLRDYLYIPLGGNRKGESRRYANLMITMLLGGLWHGAGWTFVIWGGLHGLYLSINHLWRQWRLSLQQPHSSQASSDQAHTFWSQKIGVLLTFIAVVISWVCFRSINVEMAISLLKSMAGFNGISLGEFMPHLAVEIEAIEDVNEPSDGNVWLVVGSLLLFVWLMPNTQQWIGQHRLIQQSFLTSEQGAGMKPLDGSEALTSLVDDRRVNAVDPVNAIDPASLDSASKTSKEYARLKSKLWQSLQWQPNHFWAVVIALLTVAALLNLSQVSEFLYQEF
jgi:D-alanyl-lipoteichoic acid acyltransferase DltB (MBOAT superfamily)